MISTRGPSQAADARAHTAVAPPHCAALVPRYAPCWHSPGHWGLHLHASCSPGTRPNSARQGSCAYAASRKRLHIARRHTWRASEAQNPASYRQACHAQNTRAAANRDSLAAQEFPQTRRRQTKHAHPPGYRPYRCSCGLGREDSACRLGRRASRRQQVRGAGQSAARPPARGGGYILKC